ncbi:MAG: TMEM175 family protein [Chloroflexota bacterium]
MATSDIETTESNNDTGRIEAFSDGVFSIAVTLLVLDIKVPHSSELPDGVSLFTALLQQWPVYVAYVGSFATILIMWANHHNLFKQIKRSNHGLLLVNGFLLLVVTVVPFPTSLLAEYIRHPQENVAMMIYAGTFTLISVLFNLLWWYTARSGLLVNDGDTVQAKAIERSYLLGPVVYFIAIIVSAFSPVLGFVICIGMAIFYALPRATGQ